MECNLCDFRTQCNQPLDSRQIGSNPKLMVVFDTPSYDEDFTELPFTDRSATFIKPIIGEYFPDFYMTYVLKCFNNSPFPLQKSFGSTCVNAWLNAEIAKINPKIILAMGKLAFHFVVKPNVDKQKNGITFNQNIGKLWQRPDDIMTVGWYSPQYILTRSRKIEMEFRKLLKAIEIIYGGLYVRLD